MRSSSRLVAASDATLDFERRAQRLAVALAADVVHQPPFRTLTSTNPEADHRWRAEDRHSDQA